MLLVIYNINDNELCNDTMIKVNRQFFQLVTNVSKYIKIFEFGEDYLSI